MRDNYILLFHHHRNATSDSSWQPFKSTQHQVSESRPTQTFSKNRSTQVTAWISACITESSLYYAPMLKFLKFWANYFKLSFRCISLYIFLFIYSIFINMIILNPCGHDFQHEKNYDIPWRLCNIYTSKEMNYISHRWSWTLQGYVTYILQRIHTRVGYISHKWSWTSQCLINAFQILNFDISRNLQWNQDVSGTLKDVSKTIEVKNLMFGYMKLMYFKVSLIFASYTYWTVMEWHTIKQLGAMTNFMTLETWGVIKPLKFKIY